MQPTTSVTFAEPLCKNSMMRHLFFTLVLLATGFLTAQEGYAITVNIDGYEEEYLRIANNLLDKQYLVDTAYRTDAGTYVFRDDTTALPRGIYLVVLSPENNYFQMVVGDDPDQEFTLTTSMDNLNRVEVTGSQENELFYDYLAFLDERGKEVKDHYAVIQDSTSSAADRAAAQAKADAVTARVEAEQERLQTQHPEAFISAVIRTNRSADIPEEYDLIVDSDERNRKSLAWLRAHYFDNIDLKDDRLLRTPFLFGRMEYYTDKLFVQHPDSVATAVDYILGQMDPRSELFKHYVSHFTNKAATSDIVGMDGLYVHMIDNYYKKGLAYWADPDQLAKMVENADKTRPLLIGKVAPDIKMKRRDGSDVTLHELSNKYTILYFWQFACGSCKKSTPVMKEFYAKWKDKGVEIFSICTQQREIDKCWEYIDEQEIGEWLHVTDPYMRFYKEYEITSTPTIFVLDENKVIISKRIGAKQLDELLTAYEEQERLLGSEGE